MNDYNEDGLLPAEHILPVPVELKASKRRTIIFMALTNLCKFFTEFLFIL